MARNGDTIGTPPADCDVNDTVACVQNAFAVPVTWKIEKSAPQPPLRESAQSTYTLTVTTNGEDVPTDVKDQLPEGMSLISAAGSGWSCSESDNLVRCRKTVPGAAAEQIAVKVLVDASLANQTVTNDASVGPRDGALTPGPNCDDKDLCASNTETVLNISGLSLTKSDPVPPLQAGQKSTCTLTFETNNAGVSIDIKDKLPAGLTLVSAGGGNWSRNPAESNSLTCNNPSAAATETISVEVMVAPDVTAETVTNYAIAGPAGQVPLPGPACPLSTTFACAVNESPIIPAAGFSISKSTPVPGLRVGQESTYTISVTTTGEEVDTEVKELLPTGLTLVKAEGDGWFCEEETNSLVLCRKTISNGSTEEILVTVSTEEGTEGDTLTNYASVGPDGRAPEPGENCAPSEQCAAREFEVKQPAGYTLVKSDALPSLRVGQQSVYRLTVTTNGENVVSDVLDQLPPGMSLVSIEGDGWDCGEAGNNLLRCRKEISAASSPEEIQVTVNVSEDTIGQELTNYASVGREGLAPEPGEACTAAPPFTACAESNGSIVGGPAGYEVSKSPPEPPLQVNRQSTYTAA